MLDALVENGPGARELREGEERARGQFVKGLKTNNGVGESSASTSTCYGDFNAMFRTIDRYRGVSAADVKRVAKQTFDSPAPHDRRPGAGGRQSGGPAP